jgi:hypothetical protein
LDECDEERANLKQESAIEKLARANRRRAKERKNQRRRQRKRNIAAEQEAELRVGGKVKMASDDCLTGKTSNNLDETCARDKAERGPEMGKEWADKYLNGSARPSAIGTTERNPDRDKDDI